MIELSTIRDLVAIFGVIAGFSYYVLIVRNTNRARKTQIAMTLSTSVFAIETNRTYQELMIMQWDDYDDFQRKYDSVVDPENFSLRWNMWKQFDNLGARVYH